MEPKQEMSGPSARIIADSISEWGHRLTTMEVVMHRFILAEMNTHRAFSRNSASSRAIPAHKILERVQSDPAYPVHWGMEQKGMQSGGSFTDGEIEILKGDWDNTRHYAMYYAEQLIDSGLHKSLCNRLLEPFMWHTAIISATEWDNFFYQRCSPLAQPEMKAVADAMQWAYYTSTPKELAHGEWHLPYIRKEDANAVAKQYVSASLIEISVARCARVSYLTHDGKRDIAQDIELYTKLRTSGHWSPFEHVACPVDPNSNSDTGNFVGWRQLRSGMPDENVTKFLPNLPELAQQKMRIEAGMHPWGGSKK